MVNASWDWMTLVQIAWVSLSVGVCCFLFPVRFLFCALTNPSRAVLVPGKLALHTACSGIHPGKVLPVALDVGTNNKKNLEDPCCLGLKQPRERGPACDASVKNFFTAAQDKFSRNVLIQFEARL
jgi:hypothetical protein